MNSNDAIYTGFEFEVEGFPALAIINSDLKNLENRAAYPYSVFIELIPDNVNENGHPDEAEYDYLTGIEKKMIAYLEEQTKTVHVGHTTVFRARQIIFYTANREMVEDYLEHFLPTTERSHSYEIENDPEWDNVSAFYELL
jgi:hypothetical protein